MSRAGGFLLVAGVTFVLVFASLPIGSAQQQKFFAVKVAGDSKRTITKDLGAETVTLFVAANATGSNPLNDQFDIQFTVIMNVTAPNGWAVGGMDAPGATPGNTIAFTTHPGVVTPIKVEVSVTLRQPDAEKVALSFDVLARPIYRGTPNPLTDTLVKEMSAPDSTHKGVEVDRQLETSEKVTSFVKGHVFYLLAAAGGLFVLGVVLVRKKRGGISVGTDSPVQEILPGRGASFPIQVQNEGMTKQSVNLTTSDLPEGWHAIVPVDRLDLAGNEGTTIWVTVKAPTSAQAGQHVQLNFIGTPSEGSPAEALLEAVVVDRYLRAGEPAPEAPVPRATHRRTA